MHKSIKYKDKHKWRASEHLIWVFVYLSIDSHAEIIIVNTARDGESSSSAADTICSTKNIQNLIESV